MINGLWSEVSITMEKKPSAVLNIALWIVQLILAASFIWSAYMKFFQESQLNEMWVWTRDNSGLVKLTGVLDLLAGLGLILPLLLKIKPRLTIYAAYGTVALMIAAIAFHISRGEAAQVGPNVFFLAAAAFVAWGRSRS
jgi:hypothetical protein